VTAVKVAAMTVGGFIAVSRRNLRHYTAHIEHASRRRARHVCDRLSYPRGLSSVFGTLIAVIFVQGFLIEGLRFLGDWRNLCSGPHSVAMNIRPRGLIDAATIAAINASDSQQGAGQCSNSRAE